MSFLGPWSIPSSPLLGSTAVGSHFSTYIFGVSNIPSVVGIPLQAGAAPQEGGSMALDSQALGQVAVALLLGGEDQEVALWHSLFLAPSWQGAHGAPTA